MSTNSSSSSSSNNSWILSAWWRRGTTADTSNDHHATNSITSRENNSNNGGRSGTNNKKRKATEEAPTVDDDSNDIDIDIDIDNDIDGDIDIITATLQKYDKKEQERQKRAEERERKAVARAKRIDSLLEQLLKTKKYSNDITSSGLHRASLLLDDAFHDEDDDVNQDDARSSHSSRSYNRDVNNHRNRKQTPWTAKEHETMAKGLAIYGRDYKLISELLKNRNHNQTNAYLSRRYRDLKEESKQYGIVNDNDKEALLDAIRHEQQDEEEQEHEDVGDGEEKEDEGDDENQDDAHSSRSSRSSPSPSSRSSPSSNGATPWTTKERETVTKGFAIYGKDIKAISELLKNRNYNQTSAFFFRNYNRGLKEESEKYVVNNDNDKEALLDAIRREQQQQQQQDGGDGEEKEDDADEMQDDAHSSRISPSNAPTPWTTKERETVAKGFAIYGKDIKAISMLLKNRNYNQTSAFFFRNYNRGLKEESKKYVVNNENDKDALLDDIRREQ